MKAERKKLRIFNENPEIQKFNEEASSFLNERALILLNQAQEKLKKATEKGSFKYKDIES